MHFLTHDPLDRKIVRAQALRLPPDSTCIDGGSGDVPVDQENRLGDPEWLANNSR